ncbi:MAG TPA: tetratricopeptide repeat protein [Alphaproteobacteria bacterium]|nr:tetratricopeptide repeat protein [Alphaproteobacteria bacterium]
MRSIKGSILAALLFILGLSGFTHDTPTGMHISTKSPQAHAFFEKAMAKMEMLHTADGLENFRNAVQADPQFALGHIMLTFFSQDPSEQVAEREKALATRANAGPEEKLVIDWLANASQAKWVPAIQAMNEAITNYPHDKHLHWLAGWWLQLDQNQSQRAVVMFEKVMQIDPKFADAYNEAAYCYARQGDMDKAFADIKRYTELVPNEPNPQDSFAEISRMAGRFEDALTHYRMSLKIDPSFHESQLGLGDTYALMGDQQKARVEYEKAIATGSTVQKVTWSLQLAATYVREGDLAGADKAFNAVAEQAHSKDFANLEAEAYRSMSLYQLESAASLNLLAKAEAVLHEDHKVPQSLLNQELAAVLRTRVERALAANNPAASNPADNAAKNPGESAAKNNELAKTTLKQLQTLAEANDADGIITSALHGAAGAVALSVGDYADAVNHFEADESNAISMRSLITAYDKNGQQGNAHRLAAKLAALNVPLIEQAVVVPEFRKQRAAMAAKTNPALDPRGKYR